MASTLVERSHRAQNVENVIPPYRPRPLSFVGPLQEVPPRHPSTVGVITHRALQGQVPLEPQLNVFPRGCSSTPPPGVFHRYPRLVLLIPAPFSTEVERVLLRLFTYGALEVTQHLAHPIGVRFFIQGTT